MDAVSFVHQLAEVLVLLFVSDVDVVLGVNVRARISVPFDECEACRVGVPRWWHIHFPPRSGPLVFIGMISTIVSTLAKPIMRAPLSIACVRFLVCACVCLLQDFIRTGCSVAAAALLRAAFLVAAAARGVGGGFCERRMFSVGEVAWGAFETSLACAHVWIGLNGNK